MIGNLTMRQNVIVKGESGLETGILPRPFFEGLTLGGGEGALDCFLSQKGKLVSSLKGCNNRFKEGAGGRGRFVVQGAYSGAPTPVPEYYLAITH